MNNSPVNAVRPNQAFALLSPWQLKIADFFKNYTNTDLRKDGHPGQPSNEAMQSMGRLATD